MKYVIYPVTLLAFCFTLSLSDMAYAESDVDLFENIEDLASQGSPIVTPLSMYFVMGYQTAPDVSPAEADGLFMGVGFDIGFWFGQSSYASLLGIELNTNFGGVFGSESTDGAGFYKASLALSMMLFSIESERVPLQIVLYGGPEIIGHNDVWWDTGSRINAEVGVRILARPEDSPSMLSYGIGKPIGWVDDDQRGSPQHIDHHLKARVVLGEDGDSAYSFLAHATMGQTTVFGSTVEKTDYRLMVSLGLGY